ncbi:MAG: DMT family transporter [Bacteroidetes bacterium]|nr:DMT family transporter [Bacteroidota bacterium]
MSAFCQGAGLVLAKKGMIMEKELNITINPFHATFIRLAIATTFLYVFTILRGKLKFVFQPILENREEGIKYAIAGTIFGPTLGVSLSLFTVALIEPSIAQTIFSLVPVFAIFVARILTKEKITWQSLSGVTIAMSGVMILIWREQIENLFL